MAVKDDGGWAFPLQERNDDGSHYFSHPGMSLRDWFAGQAMQGLVKEIAENLSEDFDDGNARADKALSNGASLSYMIADAMLKERARGNEG